MEIAAQMAAPRAWPSFSAEPALLLTNTVSIAASSGAIFFDQVADTAENDAQAFRELARSRP